MSTPESLICIFYIRPVKRSAEGGPLNVEISGAAFLRPLNLFVMCSSIRNINLFPYLIA